MEHPELPRLAIRAPFQHSEDAPPLDPNISIVVLRFPMGTLEIRHCGTYATVTRSWEGNINFGLTVRPRSGGEIDISIEEHPLTSPTAAEQR
jgi:hypothetical protein